MPRDLFHSSTFVCCGHSNIWKPRGPSLRAKFFPVFQKWRAASQQACTVNKGRPLYNNNNNNNRDPCFAANRASVWEGNRVVCSDRRPNGTRYPANISMRGPQLVLFSLGIILRSLLTLLSHGAHGGASYRIVAFSWRQKHWTVFKVGAAHCVAQVSRAKSLKCARTVGVDGSADAHRRPPTHAGRARQIAERVIVFSADWSVAGTALASSGAAFEWPAARRRRLQPFAYNITALVYRALVYRFQVAHYLRQNGGLVVFVLFFRRDAWNSTKKNVVRFVSRVRKAARRWIHCASWFFLKSYFTMHTRNAIALTYERQTINRRLVCVNNRTSIKRAELKRNAPSCGVSLFFVRFFFQHSEALFDIYDFSRFACARLVRTSVYTRSVHCRHSRNFDWFKWSALTMQSRRGVRELIKLAPHFHQARAFFSPFNITLWCAQQNGRLEMCFLSVVMPATKTFRNSFISQSFPLRRTQQSPA